MGDYFATVQFKGRQMLVRVKPLVTPVVVKSPISMKSSVNDTLFASLVQVTKVIPVFLSKQKQEQIPIEIGELVENVVLFKSDCLRG